ncbi:MAG: threonine synthase [Phycisphaerales bacterium]|nr:threonine synthase [Phycisphaerales bacterium]
MVPARLRGIDVLVKQEGLFPTGSYKDRGATVLMTQAARLGVRRVVEDSSGNAGTSIATYAARAGISADVFVPATTSPGKLVQIRSAGARLHRVPGDRQATSDAVWEAAQSCYYASHSWNPFFFEGTKTFAFEVCEQLGWRAPASVMIPTGNGTLLIGAWLGFSALARWGLIDRVPRLIAVQAERCAPLLRAWRLGLHEPADIVPEPTLGEGIAIARPVRGSQCLQAVRQTGGEVLGVSEEEIVSGLRETMAAGFFCEPTCAAAVAALPKLSLADDGPIVVPLTGHGLKAADTIGKLLG